LVIHLHVRKYLKPPKTYHLRFSTFLVSFYVIFVFKIALKGEFWFSGSLWSTRVDCMCLIWPNAFWGLVSIYLKSLPPDIMSRNGNFIMTDRKKHFFPITCWWNNHLEIAHSIASWLDSFAAYTHKSAGCPDPSKYTIRYVCS